MTIGLMSGKGIVVTERPHIADSSDPDFPHMQAILHLSRSMMAAPHNTDVPIAARIINADGTVISQATNQREAWGDPTAHAEILAIRQAAQECGSWRLTGCTLYVTVEPCTMCAGAINLARIDRVVFGAEEPKTGAVGSLWDALRDPRLGYKPAVRSHYLWEESAEIMREYFQHLRKMKKIVAD